MHHTKDSVIVMASMSITHVPCPRSLGRSRGWQRRRRAISQRNRRAIEPRLEHRDFDNDKRPDRVRPFVIPVTRKMLMVYRGHINNHILHVEHGIAAWRLSQLTARAVGDFRDRLRNAGASVPTTRKILATLHSVLEYAISQDWIAANPARGVKVIDPRNEGSKKIVPPHKAELNRTIGEASPILRQMILFAASTGAKAGEQWAARWGDVDFDKAQLRISRRVDAYGEEGPPKTAAGIRTVPLSAQLVSALKAWKLQSRFSKPEDLIFANRQGSYVGHV